jgi:hypothetical protein
MTAVAIRRTTRIPTWQKIAIMIGLGAALGGGTYAVAHATAAPPPSHPTAATHFHD